MSLPAKRGAQQGIALSNVVLRQQPWRAFVSFLLECKIACSTPQGMARTCASLIR